MSYTAVGFFSFGQGGYDYPDIKSGGALISWWGEDWDDDEVYVFRLRVSGLPSSITSSSQVYPLIRAYVDSIPSGLRNQEVRAIALKPSGGSYIAEIIVTDSGGVHVGKMHADDQLERMQNALSSAGHSLSIDQPAFAYINNDRKSNIAHWFAQPALWSVKSYDAAGGKSMGLGFTKSYLDQQGVWLNSSATSPQYMLRPPPPVVIEPPSPPEPSPAKSKKAPGTTPSPPSPEVVTTGSAGGVDSTAILIVGAAIAAAYFFTRKRARA